MTISEITDVTNKLLTIYIINIASGSRKILCNIIISLKHFITKTQLIIIAHIPLNTVLAELSLESIMNEKTFV